MDAETKSLVLAADRGTIRNEEQCYQVYGQAVAQLSIDDEYLRHLRDSLVVCIDRRECTVAELRIAFRRLVLGIRNFKRMELSKAA